jgi:hypothetical protein
LHPLITSTADRARVVAKDTVFTHIDRLPKTPKTCTALYSRIESSCVDRVVSKTGPPGSF